MQDVMMILDKCMIILVTCTTNVISCVVCLLCLVPHAFGVSFVMSSILWQTLCVQSIGLVHFLFIHHRLSPFCFLICY